MKINPPDFSLGEQLTAEQSVFFQENGFILFRGFLSRTVVKEYLQLVRELEAKWLHEKVNKIYGIPLRIGRDEQGNPVIQRFCFLSLYISRLHEMVNRLKSSCIHELFPVPDQGRFAEEEKDGLVLNHYIRSDKSSYKQMGWHTDSLRDLFYGWKIQPMLNIGIHLDDCPYENGGLRFIPGTHTQSVWSQLTSKKQFIDNKPDSREQGMNIEAGDLTVHHGSVWHRVMASPFTGEKSRRRVMYIPMTTGKYMPKNVHSRTPLYLKLSTSRLFKKSF